jgi:hypothetical protein
MNAQAVKRALIDSQLYVALMGALFASFFMLQEQSFRWPSFFLLFLTYLGGYRYTKFQERKYFQGILLFNIIAGLICIMLIIKNHNEIRLLKWSVICVLGFLYNSSFLKINVRKIPLLKGLYVGIIWGLMNAWLGLPEFSLPIFLVSILYITALILPFDIRDQKTDTIVTLPKLLGNGRTKTAAAALFLSSSLIAYRYLPANYSPAFILSALVAVVLVCYAKEDRKELYYSLWIESCSGLPLLFLYLGEII